MMMRIKIMCIEFTQLSQQSCRKLAQAAIRRTIMKWQKVTICGALFVLISVFFTAANAQEATVNLSSTIVGNQEQPKVLYIVPWKTVNDSELENQSIQSQLDIIFGHVERIELRRELFYMKELSKLAKKTKKSSK